MHPGRHTAGVIISVHFCFLSHIHPGEGDWYISSEPPAGFHDG
jgi:hypothetical protein